MPEPISIRLLETEGPADLHAEASSSLLDERLHPQRVVTLDIHDDAAIVHDAGSVELSAFQRASLEAYVREQHAIRQRLEASLKAELADDADDGGDCDIWDRVQVVALSLGALNVPTPEGLANMKESFYPDDSLEQIAARFDNDKTRSGFTVILRVDWDEEHQRWAQFRDEAMVSFSAE